MESQSLEIHQIGDKQYVILYDAARWLKMPLDIQYGQIAFGKLEALKAYASKRNQQPSAWDRVDEFRGRAK